MSTSNIKMAELLSEKKTQLLEEMETAYIPGVSVASVSSAGAISPVVLGTTNPKCGLMKMSVNPTQEKQSTFVNSQYILTDTNLFYYDKLNDKLQMIELDEFKLAELHTIFAKDETIDGLSGKQLTEISTITGHSHLARTAAPLTPETVFGAASLSKPMFAYLVLKLISANSMNTAEFGTGKFILPDGLTYFDLDTPLSHILPLDELSIDGISKFDASNSSAVQSANLLTARMVLSHQTGLAHSELKFQFQPGDGHGYSNMAIYYLQKVIEKLTEANLEVLAQKHIFVPLDMLNSTFIADKAKPLETVAANSLHTTPSDYARFVCAWMNDSTLQYAFIPQVVMTQDKGLTGAVGVAKDIIPDADLEHVAWGLGWGLQLDDNGKVTTAYHSGDMNEYRAWVAMNLEDKTAVVYFANSYNGHILASQIIPPTIQLEHAANYFFQKWGFARTLDELGGVTDNWGLRPAEVIPTPSSVMHDTDTNLEATLPDHLEVARDIGKQYKRALKNTTIGESMPSATDDGEVSKEHISPSPFQITLKPKPPIE